MLLSEEEQKNASSFYSPLCKSKPYLTPEQRKKLREKRKVDLLSPVAASNDETVKPYKKVRRLFTEKSKLNKVGKKKFLKKVAKVGLPELCCTAAKWVPQNKINLEKKKFFKTRSPEHLSKAKYILDYKKSRLDFSERKHSGSSLNSSFESKKNETNVSPDSAISKDNSNDLNSSGKMTENPHIVRIISIQNECTQILQDKTADTQASGLNSEKMSSMDKTIKVNDLNSATETLEAKSYFSESAPSSDANVKGENKLTSKLRNYPIFDKEVMKKMKWDSPSSIEKTFVASFRTKDKSKGCDQLIIDAGQNKIGANVCKTCGMIYTIGHEEDEKLHSENHHMYLQLKFPGWKDERVIGNYEDGRIIKILKDDKNFRLKKVQDILLIVNRDLGFPSAAFNEYLQGKNIVIVLFISSDKYVKGCLVAESISSASPVVFDERGSYETYFASSEKVRAICGINRIWVAREYRKQKIASRMVDCLRSNFILGLVVSLEELAFTDPTVVGMKFAASYTGTDHFLVYK